jgi:AcrR family transcriptional regulator
MSGGGSATGGCLSCCGGRASRPASIHRLYPEEGLAVRKRRARRKACGVRVPILVETRPNARWSLDFVSDQFAGGRRFQTAILDASLTLSSRHGDHGTTLDQIAETADVSKTIPFYYFVSKDEICAAVHHRLFDGWLAPLLELGVNDDPTGPRLALIHLDNRLDDGAVLTVGALHETGTTRDMPAIRLEPLS